MRISQFTLIAFLLFCGFNSHAQDYQIPQNYTLKVPADYLAYEPDVIKTVDWLQQTPWTEQQDKTKDANGFIIAWLTGSPTVNISIGNGLMQLATKNPQLLITYMGQYAKYALQHKDNFDVNMANAAAVRAMIAKYKKEPSSIQDSNLDTLEKTDADGKLDDWVKTNLK